MATTPLPRRIGIAGAGMISHHHLTAWSRIPERARIVAICDPAATRAERRAAEFGISNVYESAKAMLDVQALDAIDIAAPRDVHAALIDLAAERGIDALCQKPLASSFSEAEALVRRVDGRMRLMAHENWRFRPWFRTLKTWISSGEVGEVLSAQFAMISSGLLCDEHGQRPALIRQPFMAKEPQLFIAEDLIHQLDVARWLFGPLRVVSARAARTVADVAGETLATILLETTSHAPVVVSGSLVAPGFAPRSRDRLELIGTRASVSLSGGILQRLGRQPCVAEFDTDKAYQASFDAVIAHFVDCLETGMPFETSAIDNLETLRLVEVAYQVSSA
jgi:predicted dehydrogenase